MKFQAIVAIAVLFAGCASEQPPLAPSTIDKIPASPVAAKVSPDSVTEPRRIVARKAPGIAYGVPAGPYQIHIVSTDSRYLARLSDSRLPQAFIALSVGITNKSNRPVSLPGFTMRDEGGREHWPSAKSFLLNREHYVWEAINPASDRLIVLIFELPFEPSKRTLYIFHDDNEVGSIDVELIRDE